ncbi:TolC family protein [Thiomicrorhabdus indica]|uniref:TolC family protein n=1 Tax=Thiomicrorhabdus indica TaxID=2267253 RepID=UPI00102DE158|nr:TolC family protein [Thiomicrorhabdus indica]
MTNFFKKTKLAVAIALISGSAFAQAPESNIDQVLKMAIEKNPEVQASWHNFLSSGQEAKNVAASSDATVDFFADYSANYSNTTTLDNTYQGPSARLSASKMLWDGDRIANQAQSFKNTELVRYFELMDSVENTALEAYIAYQDVLRYRELAGLAQKSYNSHLEVYDKIAEGVETGFTRRADLEQINGRLALAESNLLTEKANLHDVSARFLRIVGEVPAKELKNADLNTETLPNSFDEVMNYAYDHNPSFHAAIRDIEAKLSQVQAARSEDSGRLDLTGSYNIQTYNDTTGEDNLDNLHTAERDAKVALEFRYNLYNGDRNSTAIEKAQEDMNRSEYIRDKECVDMRQTLQISYNDVKKITEQLPILNQHRNSSDRVRVAFNDQFSINQRSLLDLLDTEIEFFQSSRAYANAHYDRNVSVAKTLAEMGKLLSTLQLSRGNMPNLSDLGAEKMDVTPEMMCPITAIPEMDLGITDPKPIEVAEAMPPKFVAPAQDNMEGNTYRLEILFKFNSSEIDHQYDNDIAELAKFMTEHPDTLVEVRGHASLEGPEVYNQWLSERRAKAVVNTLVKDHNIDPARLSSIGFGETQPLINGMTQEAHQANRRIETNIKNK